jgi:cytochrome c553
MIVSVLACARSMMMPRWLASCTASPQTALGLLVNRDTSGCVPAHSRGSARAAAGAGGEEPVRRPGGGRAGRKKLYTRDCLSCHGKLGHGTSNVPSLVDGKLGSVRPGEVFWFI